MKVIPTSPTITIPTIRVIPPESEDFILIYFIFLIGLLIIYFGHHIIIHIVIGIVGMGITLIVIIMGIMDGIIIIGIPTTITIITGIITIPMPLTHTMVLIIKNHR